MQPLVVRLLGGQRGLDLVVLDDAALRGVDQEHPARLQPALADDRRRVQVEHADLAGQHDQPVVGDPEPSRPQTVAVEHRADDRAVGERHARRAVPRLHQRRVELVERAAGRVHRRVVLPRLRDHHQHRVRQRSAGQVQQLEHLVEAGGVAAAVGADREQPAQVAGQQVAGQLRLPGPHPVAVAAQRVDLAVVRDVAVRVRERPRRERVGREPRVHQDQRGDEAAVAQVREERLQLRRRQHPLVDQGARGQAREVRVRLVVGALADGVRQPLQAHADDPAGARCEEQLPDHRHDGARRGADQVGHRRDVPPAQDGHALLRGDPLDRALRLRPVSSVGRNAVPTTYAPCGGSGEVDDGAQELVRDLHEDPGAVAAARVGPGGAAVLEVAQGREPLLDDGVRRHTGERRDHGDAAGVVLVARVVQTLGCGERGHLGPWWSSLGVVLRVGRRLARRVGVTVTRRSASSTRSGRRVPRRPLGRSWA